MKEDRFVNNITQALFIVLLWSSHIVSAGTINPLLENPIDQKEFNRMWDVKCKDTGERILDPYYNIKSPPPKLINGTVFSVSDHFYDGKYVCYRLNEMERLIIDNNGNIPLVTYSKNIPTTHGVIYALYDYISTSTSNQSDFYYSNFGSDGAGLYIIYKGINNQLLAIESNWEYGYSTFQLHPISTNKYIRKNTSGAGIYVDNNSIYVISNTKILITMSGDKSHILEGEKRAEKIKFIPQFTNQNKNIHQLVNLLGSSFDVFNGSFGQPPSMKRNKWIKDWINKKGYLTLDNGIKKYTTNKERLRVWLTRYLTKHHINLIKGKKYYFSKDLGHYLIMDYYKTNGNPINTKQGEKPCIKYLIDFPELCSY